MKKVISIILLLLIINTLSYASQDPSPLGEWKGVLSVNGAKLNLILNIERAGDSLTGYLESPDQAPGAKIPITTITQADKKIVIQVNAIASKFEGNWNGASWVGHWFQGGQSLPLSFNKHILERTQYPLHRHNYSTEDLSIPNQDAIISGTLTSPVGISKPPLAILVSGSGQQDRNSTVFDHRPFAVLADYLTRQGIAVFRYDDRGVGSSTGTFSGATTNDFANDLKTVSRYFDVNGGYRYLGFVGHSEGGIISQLAVNEDTDFIILLATPGINFSDILIEQALEYQKNYGLDFISIDLQKKAHEIAASDTADITQILKKTLNNNNPQVLKYIEVMNSKWMRFLLRHKPEMVLSNINIPVLALNGSLDTQVTAKPNLEAIGTALLNHNDDVTIKKLEGLNHLFQPAVTGNIAEYRNINETFSPDAMAIIAEWINHRFQ